jgi:phosphatidate phosphatase APP1
MATLSKLLPSAILADEIVTFFPNVGYLDVARQEWVLSIHGWIYRPKPDGVARRLALRLFRRALDFHPDDLEKAIFKQRTRSFFVNNLRGKRLAIRVGQRTVQLNKSNAQGHIVGRVSVARDEARRLFDSADGTDSWVTFHAVSRSDEQRVFPGQVQLIADRGVSVISDIDDTIKVSEVGHLKTLLANTFLQDFRAVDGMADVYGKWAAGGAAFHYVSASPWQLYEDLAEFLQDRRFPAGSFHLKTVRWKDRSVLSLLAAPEKFKRCAIAPILEAFPRRRFILVGDSGESDPEVYGELARQYPEQIVRILIRDISADSPKRYQKCFTGLGRDRWQIFQNPKEIEAVPRMI